MYNDYKLNKRERSLLCDLYEIEDAEHMIIYYPELDELRFKMFCDIEKIENGIDDYIPANSGILIDTLLGKPTAFVVIESVCSFWITVCCAVSKMYFIVLKQTRNSVEISLPEIATESIA